MRADIVTARAAVAHAAWHDRAYVTRADIRAAARLALPHRRRRNPFDAPGLDEDLLDQILGDDEPAAGRPGPDRPPADDDPDDQAPTATPTTRRTADGRDRPTRAPARVEAVEAADRSTDAQPGTSAARSRRPAAPRRVQRSARARPRPGPALPHQAVHRPRAWARGPGRAIRAITSSGADGSGAQPVDGSRLGAPDRDHPRSRAHQRRRGPHRAGCAVRRDDLRVADHARATRRTWSCSASTPPGRWPRASGWSRSRRPCSRCCSTPTSAATRSAWSPSAATAPTWRCRRRRRCESPPPAGRAASRRTYAAGRGPARARAEPCGSNASATRDDVPCWWSSPTAGRRPGRTRWPARAGGGLVGGVRRRVPRARLRDRSVPDGPGRADSPTSAGRLRADRRGRACRR